MTVPEQQLGEYLHQTLGVRPRTVAWSGTGRLPAFLTALYRFALMDLDGRPLLLMVDENPDPVTPAVIRKHAEQASTKWDGSIVYVRTQVTAYNRKRLIAQRVPFIVPGNQMYLPEMGLDLREYFRTPPMATRRFRPSTQAVLIHLLLNHDQDGTTASELAPTLGYTTMTLSRAFDEIESAELAATDISGRERVLRFHASRKETWQQAQPWLIDPVKSRHFIATSPDGLRAGQDALSRYTMLAAPPLPVTAIDHQQWLAIRKDGGGIEPDDPDTAVGEVEIWKYEPRTYERAGVVDPLSLYLSVKHAADERLEQAIDALMEQVRW